MLEVVCMGMLVEMMMTVLQHSEGSHQTDSVKAAGWSTHGAPVRDC